jgi:pheromone shutdown protein TraB
MALTAQEVFTRDVRDLPSSERLRLAAMILQDLTHSAVEQSESWNDEDQQDLVAFSLEHAAQIYPEEEDLV